MKSSNLLDRPIAFHRCFAELGGSVNAGLMLSQAVYWSKRSTTKDGWFWKTAEEWTEETYLSRTEQATARKQLKRLACWQEELRGVPAKLFYRIDFDALDDLLSESKPSGIVETSFQESSNPVFRNPANKPSGILQTFITETTTEITSETTTERGEQPRQALVVTQGAPIATPPPPTGGADAASIALEYFPQMGIWQQELIENASINHLTIWRKCVEDWRDNRYSPRNINGMIDSYFKAESRQAKEKANGTNGNTTKRESHNERAARESFELIRRLTGQESGPDSSDPADTVFKLPAAFGGR